MDLINKQNAIDALEKQLDYLDALNKDENPTAKSKWYGVNWARNTIADMPSTQSEQTKMIKEIRKWINSGNRGSADYFIVDKIEEIISKYE